MIELILISVVVGLVTIVIARMLLDRCFKKRRELDVEQSFDKGVANVQPLLEETKRLSDTMAHMSRQGMRLAAHMNTSLAQGAKISEDLSQGTTALQRGIAGYEKALEKSLEASSGFKTIGAGFEIFIGIITSLIAQFSALKETLLPLDGMTDALERMNEIQVQQANDITRLMAMNTALIVKVKELQGETSHESRDDTTPKV